MTNTMAIDVKPTNSTNSTNIGFSSEFGTGVFFFACLVILFIGFQSRNEYYLTPESGGGYALGITGGVMMLLLLIYPLRKRFRFMGHIFKLKTWFRIHMLLGIVGPMCILFHCNFSLGSTNSNMALVSMCVMVLSGMIGRYFYAKIHLGLYGEKASLQALHSDKNSAVSQLDLDKNHPAVSFSPAVFERIMAIEAAAMKPRSVFGNMFRVLSIGFQTRWNYLILSRKVRAQASVGNSSQRRASRALIRKLKREERRLIAQYLTLVRKIAQLSFFARLFSLWHALHLPIFFMLVVTWFVHVYAVHSY